jgi:hypothetical protein
MAAVGRAHSKAGADGGGGTAMAALMPCSLELAQAVARAVRSELPKLVCDVANVNSDSQVSYLPRSIPQITTPEPPRYCCVVSRWC